MPSSYWYQRVRDGGPTVVLQACEETAAQDGSTFVNRIDGAAVVEIARALGEPDSCTTRLKIETQWDCDEGPVGVETLTKAISAHKGLRRFHLSADYSSQSPDVEAAVAIAEMIRVNETLVHLSLELINFGDEGMTHILRALEDNSTLRYFWTGLTYFGSSGRDTPYRSRGGFALARTLEVNKSLRSIRIQGPYSDDVVNALENSLRINTTLRELGLSGKISKNGWDSLIEHLRRNEILESLILDNLCPDYEDDSEGVLCLPGDMLVVNKTIKRLSFGRSGMEIDDDDDIPEIERKIELASNRIVSANFLSGLVSNTTLHSLDVRDALIGIEGALVVASALVANSSLQTLNLGGNWLGEAGVKVLIHPLTNGDNTSLLSLDIKDSLIEDDVSPDLFPNYSTSGVAALTDLLQNSRLRSLVISGDRNIVLYAAAAFSAIDGSRRLPRSSNLLVHDKLKNKVSGENDPLFVSVLYCLLRNNSWSTELGTDLRKRLTTYAPIGPVRETADRKRKAGCL